MTSYRLAPALPGGTGDLLVGDAGARGESWVWMGTLAEAGALRRLKLDITAEHVVAMLGKRGTGKSYTLGVLLEGLSVPASGTSLALMESPRATLVLDVLDIFWSSALPLTAGGTGERAKQYSRLTAARIEPVTPAVDVWIPAGFENPAIDLPQAQLFRLRASDLTAEDWATLFDIDLLSEPRGMLLDEVVRKTSRTGWIDDSGATIGPMVQHTVDDLLKCLVQDTGIAVAYTEPTRRAVFQRLTNASLNPLFQGTPTGLAQIMRPGRAAVMMLGRLPDAAKQLVGAFLVRQITKERQAASFAQKRLDLTANLSAPEKAGLELAVKTSIPRTWLLVDEAQVLAPTGTRSLCGESLIRFAKEGRNFGLSLAITTQQPSAVSDKLMSQVETLFVHQLTTKNDLDVATHSLKSPEPSEIIIGSEKASTEDAMRSLEQGVALFSCANAGALMPRATIVRVRPRVTAHGGYEA